MNGSFKDYNKLITHLQRLPGAEIICPDLGNVRASYEENKSFFKKNIIYTSGEKIGEIVPMKVLFENDWHRVSTEITYEQAKKFSNGKDRYSVKSWYGKQAFCFTYYHKNEFPKYDKGLRWTIG